MNQNIELVMRLYDAFAQKNIETMLGFLDENVEWGEPENPFNPAGGTKYGHEGFLDWLKVGNKAEEILLLAPKRFLTDSDSVAVIGYMKCMARSTGKIYESDFVHFVVIKDSKIVKFQEFFDTYLAGEAFRNDA